jgi:hypothetical protein
VGLSAVNGVCSIKASERRSQLLGLDAPVWTRIDAVARVEKIQPQPSSFAEIDDHAASPAATANSLVL